MTQATVEQILRTNQLHRELLSVSGFDPFCAHASSPRKQMYATHLGQTLVVEGATTRSWQTGMERAYAPYTFSIRTPEHTDIQIVAVIPRYQSNSDIDEIAHTPQYIVVYEELSSGRLCALDIRTFRTNHPYFGFDYVRRPAANDLRSKAYIPANTILFDSPNVTDSGDLMYGVELETLQATMNWTSEDGMVISESAAELFTYHTYESRVGEFGAELIPLAIHAKKPSDGYKILPDIGETVGDDGLLMAFRKADDNLAPFYQSPHALRKFYPRFDQAIYVPPGGVVEDIRVHHDPLFKRNRTPTGMEEQLLKYQRGLMQFYRNIKAIEFDYRKRRGDALKLSPEFTQLVEDAIPYTDERPNARPQRQFRVAKLDDWRVEVIVKYRNVPSVGHKTSGGFGDKGIVVKVVPDADMPVDDRGNRAHFISDPMSTIGRSTIGRAYEPFFNAAGRDIVQRICSQLGLRWGDVVSAKMLEIKNAGGRVRTAFKELQQFYHSVSPQYMGPWHDNLTDAELYEHMAMVITRTLPVIFKPPSDEKEMVDIIHEVQQNHAPYRSPVTYRGPGGEMVRTQEHFSIGKAYIILLDKTGVDRAAIASCKLNHFGVPSQITRQDKHSSPNRRQPTRCFGEAEMRIVASYCQPWVVAEVIDRNTNKDVMTEICDALLNTATPSSQWSLVDRDSHPYGASRPMQIVRQLGECAGWGFHYEPYVPLWGKQEIEEFKRNEAAGAVDTKTHTG